MSGNTKVSCTQYSKYCDSYEVITIHNRFIVGRLLLLLLLLLLLEDLEIDLFSLISQHFQTSVSHYNEGHIRLNTLNILFIEILHMMTTSKIIHT
jgi:hypothetical protein